MAASPLARSWKGPEQAGRGGSRLRNQGPACLCATICYLDRTSGERTPASVPITSLFGPQALYVSSCVDCPSLLKGHDLKSGGLVQGAHWKLRGATKTSHGAGRSALQAPPSKARGDPPLLVAAEKHSVQNCHFLCWGFHFPPKFVFIWSTLRAKNDVSFLKVTPEWIHIDGSLPT